MLQAFTSYNSTVDQNLTNQVVYRVWLVAKDSLGNEQTALSSVTVKTVRTTPPVFQELLVQYNAPTSVYVEVIFAACVMYQASVDEADSCCCMRLLAASSSVLHARIGMRKVLLQLPWVTCKICVSSLPPIQIV